MSMRYLAGFISAFYNPFLVPDTPTIGTASPASTISVSVTFTAPTNVGGGAITGYIATAKKTSDGTTVSATGASSPITITGLTAVAYTVTVAAVNAFGPSASSAASNSVSVLSVGDSYGGGYYAGQIGISGVATHNLVVGPFSTAHNILAWKTTNTSTAGTSSVIDGPANTAAMIAAGAAAHPCAQFCDNLVIGGFSDWYMPAQNELEVCYYNLKPTTTSNNTSSGINANAVPARASNYTTGTPAQTSAANFQATGTEDFTRFNYWCSTEFSATQAPVQVFGNGRQYNLNKYYGNYVRAVRRVAV